VTFTLWLVPILALGVALIFAPLAGGWWARDFRPRHCETCGRELVGSPPEHRLSDRDYCRWVAQWEASR